MSVHVKKGALRLPNARAGLIDEPIQTSVHLALGPNFRSRRALTPAGPDEFGIGHRLITRDDARQPSRCSGAALGCCSRPQPSITPLQQSNNFPQKSGFLLVVRAKVGFVRLIVPDCKPPPPRRPRSGAYPKPCMPKMPKMCPRHGLVKQPVQKEKQTIFTATITVTQGSCEHARAARGNSELDGVSLRPQARRSRRAWSHHRLSCGCRRGAGGER